MPPAKEQSFFDWTSLQFNPAIYARRREKIMELLAETGAIFLVPSRHGPDHNTFRQNDDFNYFTGLELPDSMLVLDPIEGVTLYAPRRDARFENPDRLNDFPGRPLADDTQLAIRSGITRILPFDEFTRALESGIALGRIFKVNPSNPAPLKTIQTDFIYHWDTGQGLVHHLHLSYPSIRLENGYAEVARMRMIKGAEEVEAIRAAYRVTEDAVRATAPFIRPGVDERSLAGILEGEYKKRGSQRPAFDTIIKGGPNSLWAWRILSSHYNRRNYTLQEGELVIFDVGAELDCYICDIGRTFPVSGSFTDAQKAHLDMVTYMVEGIISAIRPGVTLAELRSIALDHLPKEHHPYAQVGNYFGHHIGLYSGDPSLLEAPLEPGMVFTVEPWYYNHDHQISVFVEENVVVTENGVENISNGLPTDTAGLEALMKG